MEYTRQQLAESVKNKYPQYAAIDNDQLADSILKKYPQYRTKLDDGGLLDSAKKYTQAALAGFSDVGYATLEGVASGISRLTGDSDLVKTVSDFRNYSKEFYEGSVSDEDKSKFGYKAVTTIAQTPAYMAAAATGPIGLSALTANAYQQGRDDYLSTQGVTSVSASEDQLKEADKVGAFSAVPIVVLERFGATRLVDNIFRGQSKVTIREAGKRIASSAVGEGLTEGSQTIFQNTLASELMQYDPDREITEGVFESILLGAVAGGTVTTPFVGYQAFQDRNLSPDEQAVEQGVDPDTELTYTVSYINPKNDEQSILNLQAANPEEAVRLATQGLGDRAVNIKYEGINTSDFKVEKEVTPDPVVEEEAAVEEEVVEAELTQDEIDIISQELAEELDPIAQAGDRLPNILDEKDITVGAFTPYRKEMMPKPEVVKAALPIFTKLKSGGRITPSESKQLASVIDRVNPVRPYKEVPPPASESDMLRGLAEDKREKINQARNLPTGTFVKLRLDIPAYRDHGVWVPTIHGATEKTKGFRGGASISHQSTSVVTNPRFGIVGYDKPAGQVIATGIASKKETKIPIATILGQYVNLTEDQAVARANAAIKDPSFIQVGMDPKRRGYFYDRSSMQEVMSADEVIQIGPLVLAKNPVYGKTPRNEFLSREVEGAVDPDVVAGAAPVQTIDFIKGASGDPAQNLASKKRRRAGTGEGKNPSLRLEVNGKPIYIGKDSERGGKSFEGWTEETSAWFTDQEISNAAGWYDSLKSKFTKEFGPKRGPKMMLAWLASQQNESPAGGVRNTFRVIDRLTGIKSGKKGGLADEKLEAIFTDTLAEKGLDAKLSDFIDAGMGKRTRTFMGDSPEGGMPFVADVHTGRDSGKLDQQTLTRIKRFSDNGVLTVDGQPASVEITKVKKKTVKGKTKTEPEEAILRVGGQEVQLVRDLTGSPSKGEYEGISDWGNRLTDYLNSIGWKGRTDWIPAEVQAVGWMRILRQYGLKESDLESSLIENTFRVAAEVDYGLGSKITQIYPDFQKLNEQQKTVITEDVLSFIVPRVQQEMAPSAILRDEEFGIGSWEGSVSPSGNFYIMGSSEAANIFTNSLAWVTEQAGTMQAVIGKGGKNQRAVALVGLSNNELSNFVDFVNQLQTGADKKAARDAEALRGFSTRAMPGEQGIIVFGLTESKARGVENTLQKFAEQYTGSDSLTIQNFSAVTTFTENNWKDNQNGESYIQEIEQSGSTGNIRERLLRLRQQYGQRLAETGQRIAPEVFGEISIQSRVDQFVEAGKEYLEGTGTDVIAKAAPTDETAQVAPTDPGGTFNQNTLDQFITKNFLPLADKIGVDIIPNYTVPMAQYNATQGVIEYNPAALAQQDQKYITAAMREEMIHAAMSKVILQKAKGKNEGEAFQSFMSSLGKSLTPEQRTAISQVYSGLETDAQFGAEYSRAAIQQALYGDLTESYIRKGPAFEKLKSLLKSVQSYLARTLGAEVKANPEAAGVIRASAELLQQVDPSAKLINQTIVKEATAQSAPVFPNSNYGFAVQGEPFNERKIEVTAFDKYAKTMNALLADIDPSLKGFSNQYYYNIESKSLDRLRAALPFVEKYRGIEKKSKRDFQRLKRLLLFSEVSVSERGQNFIKERDALLKKYGMYNDFQLGPRFILDEILDEGTKAGVEMGKVYDYMPRFINDLDKVKNYYGKSAKTGFREYIKGTKDSEGNVIIKGQNQEIKEARARLDELQEQGQPVPESVRELANKEIIPVLGGKETAYYEAIYFDDYLRQEGFKKPKGATPSSTKERTVGVLEGDLIPSKIIDAYDDIDVALERYIYNMTSSLETLRIIGRRYTYEDTGIKINKNEVPSDLSVLLRELVAANRITEEQAEGIIPDIFQRAVRVRKQEAAPLELLRSLGYISGLVEFTSTLSQLLDTTFVTVKNNPIGTLSAILNNTVTGQMVGIDVEQIASEFVQDKTARTDGSKFAKAANLSNKSLRKLLMTTGFRQLDMRMKNANLTANFNRYRKLTNGYYRDRNSNKSKLFASELSYLGLSPNQQIQFMAELKRFKPGKPNSDQFRNAPLVRQVLFSRLNESQPMSKGSRPLAATENPNAQILYMMKSFMVNQMNNARSEIINRIADPRLSNLERRRAVIDLLRLLAGLAAIGMPVAGLKDFIAGRLGYLNDYLINSLLSPLGISTYTGYKIKREGIFGAAVSYFAPVSLQMAGDMLLVMQRLSMGQKVQPKDITAFGPYSEIINRVFGFNTESQLRKYERKKKVGQDPIVIPSEIKLPQRLF